MCYYLGMHKILFKIGKLTVYTYGFLIAIGLVCAIVLFYFLSKKFKLSEKSFNFYSTNVIISIVIGFLFANLYQAIYDWIESGFKEFGFNSSMTFMGGLIGGVAAFIIITAVFAKGDTRKDFWKTANLMAPCIPLAHGFGRIGCFFAGCCYGKASVSPIAVKFPGMSYSVLPTQLFEAVFLFVLFGVLMFMLFKFKRIDLQLIVYLGSYAIWRFIIEYFRGDHRGEFIPGMSPSQAQSILMLLVAGALAFYIFYFDRIPFCGKLKIGRSFKEYALAERGANADAAVAEQSVSGEAESTEKADGSEETDTANEVQEQPKAPDGGLTQ